MPEISTSRLPLSILKNESRSYPKNLASALIMFGIRWMVKSTNFRFFTAYSDTEAWELGTIYQACNFVYLGQTSGAKYEFFDPKTPNKGPFSDRQFRKTSQIKRYAKELGIPWRHQWSELDRIYCGNIPDSIVQKLKSRARLHQERCQKRKLSPKKKYVYSLGVNKNETAGSCISLRTGYSAIRDIHLA